MRLTLFMTRGMSLRRWQEAGMFAREVALYKRLREAGVEIGIVTYGDKSESIFCRDLDGFKILWNDWGLPVWLYAMLIPQLHKDWLVGTDLFKSNQTNGAEVAQRVAKICGKPLIARCGYMWSTHTATAHGESSLRAYYTRYIERRVFTAADSIVVTTNTMIENVESRFPHVRKKIVRIPNYVETDRFAPSSGVSQDIDLLFIGRLSHQKNLENLLIALQSTELSLAIVGPGQVDSELQRRFGTMDGRISWLGTVPNFELPDWFRRAKLFVQPSYYEGHPKALLEALASGMAVLGTSVSGIRDVIQHGENGWLCDPSADSIREALIRLIGDEKLRKRLGHRGREYVLENCGLDRVVDIELELYKKVIAESA